MTFSASKVLEARDEYHSLQKINMFRRQLENLNKKLNGWGFAYLKKNI